MTALIDTALINTALLNAIVVLPLAGSVWLVSRVARRPALTHALWIVVLLKLVTPPLFQLPVSISVPMASHAEHGDVRPTPVEMSSADVADLAWIEEQESPTAAVDGAAVGLVTRPSGNLATSPLLAASALSHEEPADWFAVCARQLLAWWSAHPVVGMILVSVWLAGTVLSFAMQGWLAVRFARCIVRE